MVAALIMKGKNMLNDAIKKIDALRRKTNDDAALEGNLRKRLALNGVAVLLADCVEALKEIQRK